MKWSILPRFSIYICRCLFHVCQLDSGNKRRAIKHEQVRNCTSFEVMSCFTAVEKYFLSKLEKRKKKIMTLTQCDAEVVTTLKSLSRG